MSSCTSFQMAKLSYAVLLGIKCLAVDDFTKANDESNEDELN